jgi:hypothetical protein
MAHHEAVSHERFGDVPFHDFFSLTELNGTLIVLHIYSLVDWVDLAVSRLIIPSSTGHLSTPQQKFKLSPFSVGIVV